jgi:hypothetical protein
MKCLLRIVSAALPALLMAGVWSSPAAAQTPVPIFVPIVVDTAVPIVVSAIKPKPTGLGKFEGFVMHANTAQITVRAKGNDMGIQTFSLSEAAAAKMQQIIDKGGYQFGDKVTILYEPTSLRAVKIKGKPSRPL